ncbi:hypothetical protein WUBG_11942, partial [Wuchereria bancrofti]
MSLLLMNIFHPQQSSLFQTQFNHPLHFAYQLPSSRNIKSKFVAKISKKAHEASNIRANLRHKLKSHGISKRSKRFGICNIWKRQISSSLNENDIIKFTTVNILLQNFIATSMVPVMILQYFSERNMMMNNCNKISNDYHNYNHHHHYHHHHAINESVSCCLNDGSKIDVATETKPGLFIVQNATNNSLFSKSYHPSMNNATTCRLSNDTTTDLTSTESLNETFEAVLESLRRSLKKHRPRNTSFERTLLTQGFSIAVKKFNPLHSYKKLSLKRFKDERNFVEQKLNTFIRISDLGLGRKFIKISDLKCCKYFYQLHIIHECRLMGLQRPKKKPLHEYYNDDDAELEALARVVDPLAPRPEGSMICPARGDHASVSTSLPRSIDFALHKYGTSQPRMVAAVVLDHSARPAYSLTYGKLLNRATKVAHMLLTKFVPGVVGKEKVQLCKSGDRVALVYPNTEPLSFLVAFYGCILAGIIPVPVEVPLTKR